MFSKIKTSWLLLQVIITAWSWIIETSATSESGKLMLTPLIRKGKLYEARIRSRVEGLDHVEKSFAGFITANETLGNHLFFWFFKSITAPEEAPLLIWLNGGPGISSLNGMFLQHGPIKLNEGLKSYSKRPDGETLVGPFSVLYIDNPVGVGFSYSDSGDHGFRTTQEGYGNDLYQFMKQFLDIFPEYKYLETYIGGQSYAGKYVLVFADFVDRGLNSGDIVMNFQGIFLGSPLYDPESMFKAAGEFPYALGIISTQTFKTLRREQEIIFEKFANNELPSNESTSSISRGLNRFESAGPLYNFLAKNYFNIFATQNISDIPGLRVSVHVGKANYTAVNRDVYESMVDDIRISTKSILAKLMSKYKVLIYNGNLDIIISNNMIEAALRVTQWSGHDKYKLTERKPWVCSKEEYGAVGYFSKIDKFCRVVIHGAGHNAGYEKPRTLVSMMKQFAETGCVEDEVC